MSQPAFWTDPVPGGGVGEDFEPAIGEIGLAQRREGQTLFDQIVEIDPENGVLLELAFDE